MSNHIKTDEFIEIAIEQNCNPHAIIAYIKENLNPNYAVNTTQLNNRIANYRRKGLLPLRSGNRTDIGTILKGTSTLYDMDGNLVQQWVKADVPRESTINAFETALEALLTNVKPAQPIPSPEPVVSMSDLLTMYPLGDPHIGMLAHAAEVGEDNDLSIIIARLRKAIKLSVDRALPTDTAFILDTGDFFHADDASNSTPRGKNPLDVDGRYHKVMEVGLEIAAELIEIALTKHQHVHWRSAEGNHNPHSSVVIGMYLKAYFRNEPRVTIHTSPKAFYYFQFGKCLLGFTHGHTCKPDKLGELMAVDCEDIWSTTMYRYWLLGHVHHQSVKEYPSCIVETFRTLSGKDAWHASMGYRSGQDMKVITYHKDHGEVDRNTINISLIT